MRIVFLGDAIAEHLRRWSRFFVHLGHEVHVVTWNPQMLDGFAPVVVHLLQKPLKGEGVVARGVNYLRLRAALRRTLSRLEPDLVHAHSAGAYAWLAMLAGFHPYMVSPWGDDVLINIHHSALDRYLTGRSLRRADLVHCDGENMKQAVVDLGVDADRVALVTFGVDVKRFAPAAPPPELLVRYGLAGSKVVVSTRTLNPVHDVESVVRAVPLVLQREPAAKFLIVGSGAEEENLRRLAVSLGVSGAVAFTGHVDEDEMVACLRAAQVYVSTSTSESGLAASTAEAMACGLPVINTDTGDIRLWIQDGEAGFIVPVRSPDVLAERIVRLLQHEEDRKKAGAVNRKTIEERNNVYVEMKKMENLYLNLVGQSAKP